MADPFAPAATPGQPPKLLDQLRAAARSFHFPASQVERFAGYVKQLIFCHGIRHPSVLQHQEIVAFLAHLGDEQHLPLASCNEALDALHFLYREVLRIDPADSPVPQSLPAVPPPAWTALPASPDPPQPPRLLDQMRHLLRARHYALDTEECYLRWARQFILFHNKRHPRDMGPLRSALSSLTSPSRNFWSASSDDSSSSR
jgi:hypothetical protein